jgi:hypothetical protein
MLNYLRFGVGWEQLNFTEERIELSKEEERREDIWSPCKESLFSSVLDEWKYTDCPDDQLP